MKKNTQKKNKKNKKKTLKKKNFEKEIYTYRINFDELEDNYLKSGKNNKDKLIFEELSTQILLQLDNIQSNGNDLVRIKRKSLINYITDKLEGINSKN